MLFHEVEDFVSVEVDIFSANSLNPVKEPELAEVGHILAILLNPPRLHHILFVLNVLAKATKEEEEECAEEDGSMVGSLTVTIHEVM